MGEPSQARRSPWTAISRCSRDRTAQTCIPLRFSLDSDGAKLLKVRSKAVDLMLNQLGGALPSELSGRTRYRGFPKPPDHIPA